MSLILLGLILGALTILAGSILVWTGRLHILNPIRAFAVLIVAIIVGYVMTVGWRLIDILKSPDWCARPISAEKMSPGTSLDGLKACINLMGDQIDALAIDSHISQATLALCLLTLMVIVIAGGKLNFRVDKTGASGSIGKDDVQAIAAAGAAQAAGAAVDEAHDIATGAAPAPKPAPKFTPPPGEQL